MPEASKKLWENILTSYRKQPVVIEAVQIREDNDEELMMFLDKHNAPFEIVGDHELVIHTLEGDMRASKGDWIIRGVKGEFYPCKPEIFSETYEEVPEGASE